MIRKGCLVLIGALSTYGVFLLRQFYLGIPMEFSEAAIIDGASHWDIYTKIMLPNLKPELATLTLFTFLGRWNDFLAPFILLNSAKNMTIPLGLKAFATEYNVEFAKIMAGSTAAISYICNASSYLLRDNGAVHQNLKFDAVTGELLKVYSSQGEGNEEGCWSRGQAWAIYGFALSYLYTGDKRLLEISKICTNYFLNRLQSDYCANWDFIYRDDKDQRDTSAVSIAACGILELAKQLPLTDPDRHVYEAAAKVLISRLTENYLYTKKESCNGLLKAGVYSFKSGLCVNEPTVWGDYYYMEALTRLTHIHRIFW